MESIIKDREDSEDFVYHYCSNETFLSIFNNQTFRLNDCLTTNDSKEMKIFVDEFETFLLEEFQKETFKIFADVLTPKIEKIWAAEALKYYFQRWTNYVLNSVALFILCFTSKGDDLSQWYMYADNSYGVNIGLEDECFSDLCKQDKGFEFIKVKYIATKAIVDIQKQLAIELCEDLKELFTKTPEIDLPNRNKHEDDTEFRKRRNNFIMERRKTHGNVYDIFNKLLFKGILYKDKAFSHEEEWRLIYNPNNNKKQNMQIKYYIKDRVIRKYIELSFSEIEDFFAKVKLGPKNPNTHYSVDSFLNSIDSSVSYYVNYIEVSKSKIPFV